MRRAFALVFLACIVIMLSQQNALENKVKHRYYAAAQPIIRANVTDTVPTVVVVIPSVPRDGSITLIKDMLLSYAHAALLAQGLVRVRCLVFNMSLSAHAALDNISIQGVQIVQRPSLSPYQNPDEFLSNWNSPNHGVGTTPATRRQTADFASALHYAAENYPAADILLWEDDCLFCPDTFRVISQFLRAVNGSEYCMLKMGYGGSGHLIQRRHTLQLAEFVFAQTYWTFVDISIHRFLSFHRYASFATVKAMALHKGVRSTFADKGLWNGVVGCDRSLDIYWGSFAPCHLDTIGVRCVDTWLF